jgi:lysophospholipase L1-like esterase
MRASLFRVSALILTVALAPAAGSAAPSAAFSPGDRWAVLGDSITHSGAYHREVELFYLTRLPSAPLDVINCGIAGDTASGAIRRLDWDCLAARPTVVSVMFGMNDVGRQLYAPDQTGPAAETARESRAASFEKSLRELTRRLRDAGARVILIQPSPFDDTAQLEKSNLPGCGPALANYAEKIRTLAAELGLATVDFSGPMTALNRAQQARDPRFTLIGPDRVHPGKPGHLVMAYLFLQAQSAPGLVSSITLDAATGRAGPLENAAVSAFAATRGSVSFTAIEGALPFPVDPEAASALDLVPFTASLNRQLLRVTGLAPGLHHLAIDGQPVADFPATDLAAGINLANHPNTPQYRQALAVRATLARKWDATAKLRTLAYGEHTSWPDAPRPLDPAAMSAKIQSRLNASGTANSWVTAQLKLYLDYKPRQSEFAALAAAALAEARSLAIPRPHRYTLIRIAAPREKS